MYAITPDGQPPIGDPEAETGATAFEPQVLSSLSACEALSDNTGWAAAGTSVFCMPCDSAVSAWSSGVSDTIAVIFAGFTDGTVVGVMPEDAAYPDYSSGTSDPNAYFLSAVDARVLDTANVAGLYMYVEGLQVIVSGTAQYIAPMRANSGISVFEVNSCWLETRATHATGSWGMYANDFNVGPGVVHIWNSVISGASPGGYEGFWFRPLQAAAEISLLHNLFYDWRAGTGKGVAYNDGIAGVTNCVVFNTDNDFSGMPANTIFSCASDDNDGANTQNLNENGGGEWDAAFEDYLSGDFRAKAGGLLENNGAAVAAWTTLMGDTDPLATDMAGNARSGVSPEIGPFEITAVPSAASVEEPTQWQMLIGF